MKDILNDADAAAGAEVPRAFKPVPPTQELDQAAVEKLFSEQANKDGVFKFDKGYYEVNLKQSRQNRTSKWIDFSLLAKNR